MSHRKAPQYERSFDADEPGASGVLKRWGNLIPRWWLSFEQVANPSGFAAKIFYGFHHFPFQA